MSVPAPNPESISRLVFVVRGERVLIDADLAVLYGVETGALNRAVRRNIRRFPEDFMFRLTASDWENLKCQVGISSSPTRTASAKRLGSQSVTSIQHGGRRGIPYVFTEQGIAMLSSVLHSSRAVEVNIAIMRTFVQLRRLMDSNRDLARKIEAMEKKYDEHFAVVFEAIRQLVADDQSRKAQPNRRIGF